MSEELEWKTRKERVDRKLKSLQPACRSSSTGRASIPPRLPATPLKNTPLAAGPPTTPCS